MANSISHQESSTSEETIPLSISDGQENQIINFIESDYETVVRICDSNKNQSKVGWRKYIGLISAFAAGFLISISALVVKMLHKFHPFTVSMWRYAGNIPVIFALFTFYFIRKRNRVFQNLFPSIPQTTEEKHHEYKWTVIFILFGNGILAWACANLRFYSLQYLTLADTSVIAYSSPVFVVIFAHFCLKEKCGITSILLSIVAVIGVVIIARPPLLTGSSEFDNYILLGTILAVGSMLAHTCICIVIRKGRKVHFSLVIFVHGITGFILSCIASGSIGMIEIPQEKNDIFYAIIVVLSGFGTQVLLTLAFKFEEAAPVSLILCLEVILTFLWQYIFLDTSPDVYSIIGSTIIMIAVSVAIIRKWLFGLPKENVFRKICCIILH